jgi:hypothetical protein
LQIGKEEVELSLYADDIILHLKDLKIPPKKLLDLTNTFGNVAGYKISMQKSVAFLYTNNEQAEKERNQKNNLIHNNLKKIPSYKINQRGERSL